MITNKWMPGKKAKLQYAEGAPLKKYEGPIDIADISINMDLQLDKINPKFRELVDLFLFSDRLDLDLAKFKDLLKENYGPHCDYLWNRFNRSINICWEDNVRFWSSRLNFLLSLNDKSLSKRIEALLEKRMFDTVKAKFDVDINYNIEYLQFVEFCKIKHARKEPLENVKNYLTEMPSHMRIEKLISIVNSFVPYVFSTIDEYVEVMSKKIITSSRNYEILLALEAQGILFNRKPVNILAKELMMERERKAKNCRAFFTLLNDVSVRDFLKKEYQPNSRNKLMALVKSSDLHLLEDFHLRNIKNLLDLDPNIADELTTVYADKLYARKVSHKHANPDRLIRLLKSVPQISQRKVLVYLSSNDKMSDIKHVISAFPDLRKLAAFV